MNDIRNYLPIWWDAFQEGNGKTVVVRIARDCEPSWHYEENSPAGDLDETNGTGISAGDMALKLVEARNQMIEGLCGAFLSEVGCLPSDAEIIYQTDADGMKIHVRRRAWHSYPDWAISEAFWRLVRDEDREETRGADVQTILDTAQEILKARGIADANPPHVG